MLDSLLWTVPLLVGAALWAGCDVISDGVIAEVHEITENKQTRHHHADQDTDSELDVESQKQQQISPSSSSSSLESSSTTTSTANSSIEMIDISDYKKSDNKKKPIKQEEVALLHQQHQQQQGVDPKLTGEQDSLISGIVMFFCGLFLHIYYGSNYIFSFYNTQQQDTAAAIGGGGEDLPVDKINPVIVLYCSIISGIFQCFSLIYLLKSFETSSSTVIVPLMQLNSLFVLPISIILSLLSNLFPILSTFHKIITPTHLVAFTFIFFGGFYPSVEGEWSQFTKTFWKQRAVRQVLISDLLIAIYYIVVSFCTNESGGMTSMSFLVLSIYGNSLTFLFLVLFVPLYRRSALQLLYIRRKYVLLSALGEILSLAGYFFVSISYRLYYNSGIVSATEGALNQLFNLIAAILLKRFFNFGREVKRIKEKLYSCVLVTIGLILTST